MNTPPPHTVMCIYIPVPDMTAEMVRCGATPTPTDEDIVEGEAVKIRGLTGHTAAARETVVTGVDEGEPVGLESFPFCNEQKQENISLKSTAQELHCSYHIYFTTH